MRVFVVDSNRTALRSLRQKRRLQTEHDKPTARQQWLAWPPTHVEQGFHDPERFGVVELVAKPQQLIGRP